MVRSIFAAYEQFYGKPSSPPIDIIKRVIRTIIEISPEALNLLLDKDADICGKVLDRVVERIYKTAENELLKQKEIEYIS